MRASEIRILIVDDHPVVRAGLRQMIDEAPGLCVADEANTGREAIRKTRAQRYDLVLLDISLPDTSGLEVLRTIKDEKPDLPVLMLSFHAEEQYAIRALKAGAAGYLSKESAADELISAIRHVRAGGRYVSPELAEHLAHYVADPGAAPPHERLSDREYMVIRMLANGKSLAQIGKALIISPKTVSTYRERALSKLGLANNAELVQYAMKHDLIDTPLA